MAVDIDDLQRQIDEVRLMAEDALDKFPLRSTTTPGASRERHIHDLGKHPGGVIAARVHNAGDQSINNETWTTLTFDSERFDTDTIHSTSSNTGRLTAKTAGKYTIYATVTFANNATGRRIVRFRFNGSTVIAEVGEQGLDNAEVDTVISALYEFAVDDFVEVQAWQSSGGGLAIKANSNYSPEFAMARIGAAGISAGGTPGPDHGGLTGRNDDDHVLYILQAGTRAFTGDQSMGVNKITSLATPTAGADAATKDYVDANVGGGGGDVPSPHDETHHTGDVLPDADQAMVGKLTVKNSGTILELQNTSGTALFQFISVGASSALGLRGIFAVRDNSGNTLGQWRGFDGKMRLGDGVQPVEQLEVAGNGLLTGTVRPQLGLLLDEQSTPSNPAKNTVALFARANGDNIEIVALSSEGTECVITHNCTLDDTPAVAAPANILTLQWIE